MNEGKNLYLAINAGSSSIKAVLCDENLHQISHHQIDNIGEENSQVTTHTQALEIIIDKLKESNDLNRLAGVGHRIVDGGPNLKTNQIITNEILEELETYTTYDPDHMPYILEIVEYIRTNFPGTPNVACFDSQFFVNLPELAKILPIPRKYTDKGIVRHGYHGLSYTYLLSKIPDAHSKKIVFAHLGSGASLCAVNNGQPFDTTMSYTPTSGIPMSSRSGDIDPMIVLYLIKSENLTIHEIDDLLNYQSGLKGISDSTGSMEQLIAMQDNDQKASEAVDKFVYEVKKVIGAYSAVMGGLDMLVFSGGIGEKSAEIRRRICDGLDYLNIKLDQSKNSLNEQNINISGTIEVKVMHTDEEIIIARETIKKIKI